MNVAQYNNAWRLMAMARRGAVNGGGIA